MTDTGRVLTPLEIACLYPEMLPNGGEPAPTYDPLVARVMAASQRLDQMSTVDLGAISTDVRLLIDGYDLALRKIARLTATARLQSLEDSA